MFRKAVSVCLTLCLMLTALVFNTVEVKAANVDVWTDSSLASIFKDDVKVSSSDTQISLVAAKNEYESAQIAIRSTASFNITSVTFSNLTSGANTISNSNIRYNFVDYMYLDHNSGGSTSPTRLAPAYFPEYLLNDVSRNVPANTTQPIWINVYIPTTSEAGNYTGTATVNTSVGNFTVNMNVEVANVAIPNSNVGNYTLSNWTITTQFEEFSDWINSYYGYTRYSTAWWELMDKFAQNMKEHRNNQFQVQAVGLLRDGGSTVAANGTITFNWTKFDELIQFFMDRGVVKRLESGHLLLGSDVFGLKRNSAGQTVAARMPYGSGEAASFATQYFAALKAHLITKGWFNIWYQSIGDEVLGADAKARWKGAYDNWLNVYAPGMKVIAAFFDSPQNLKDIYDGRLDVFVPQIVLTEEHETYLKSRQAQGDEYWDYTTGGPQGESYNRSVDMQLARVRMLHWYNYSNGITGHMHWAWNFWEYPNDTSPMPGDNGIVYPDPPNASIKNTLRQVAVRDGVEEYELFKILEASNTAFAQKLASSVAGDLNGSLLDRKLLLAKHAELVRAAAGQSVQDPTMSAFNTIQAENFSQTLGVSREKCTDQGETQNICNVNNGDYVLYDSVDFGTGALGAEFRVASEVNGGNIEIRLDSLTGPLVGTVKVSTTGGWQTWKTQRLIISGASGIHKVYLKFINTSTPQGLINVNWFKFTKYNCSLEAENAALAGGAAIMTYPHSGYTGTGFVDGYWNVGASTTFTISNIPEAGTYCVYLRYSNGDPVTRTLSIYVNGVKVKQFSMGSTGNWDTWAIAENFLSLNTGTNTITFKYDSTDSGNANLDNIQLFPLSKGYLKPATASSVQGSGYEASKGVDANWGTRWSSVQGVDPQWLYVDLGAIKSISRICISWEAAYAKAYKIQVSNDAASWMDVYSTTQGDGGVDEVNINPVNARYVRVYGTQRGTTYGYSIWELEVN